MKLVYIVLMAVGLVLTVQPLEYLFAVRWYQNNPDKEKNQYFEQLDTVYRNKYVKWGSIAAGIICIVCSFIIGHYVLAF